MRKSLIGTEFDFNIAAAIVFVFLVFAAFWTTPFRLEGDAAYSAKLAAQYAQGYSSFNYLRLVDPRDLSKDVQTWIYWWPPGIPAALAAFMTLGLSISVSARLLMLAAALAGASGWALVATAICPTARMRAISLIPVFYYVVQSGMPFSFASGDPIVFGIMPWLILLTLRLTSRYDRRTGSPKLPLLFATCFALGAIYWVKFSAILATVALLASILLAIFSNFSNARRIALLLAAFVFYLMPIAALWLTNVLAGGDIVSSHIALGTNDSTVVAGALKAMSGIAIPFSPGAQRLFHAEERSQLTQLMIYLPGLFLLLFVLIDTARASRSMAALAAMLAFVPLLALSYLTLRSNYPFIADAERHGGPYWIFIQFLLIVALMRRPLLQEQPRFLALLATAYCFALALFAPYASVRLALKIPSTEAAPISGLYVPSLSPSKPAEVSLKLHELIHTNDVVVPATYWLGQETWLELPGRLLPLTNFWEPLMQTHGHDSANYFSSTPFRSSSPLRVVLVAPNPYARPEYHSLVQLQKERFPQASNWSLVPAPFGDDVQIWTADLEVR